METIKAYIMFTDIKGFTSLNEEQFDTIYSHTFIELSKIIISFKDSCVVWNTWGDALIAVTTQADVILKLAFGYRDFFANYDFEANNLPKLSPRIAAHFGEFDLCYDPLLGAKNVLGKDVNLTARIEPITRINEIYVTDSFKSSIEQYVFLMQDTRFETIGHIPLAKNFGNHLIYRLKKRDEEEKVIDCIFRQNLEVFQLHSKIEKCKQSDSIEQLKQSNPFLFQQKFEFIKKQGFDSFDIGFLLKLAKLSYKFGFAQDAFEIVQYIEQYSQNIDGISIYIYKNDLKLLLLKAKVLIKLDCFEEAANLLHGLLHFKNEPIVLLEFSNLYNARALKSDPINYDLLNQSLKLILEAFRKDISDYQIALKLLFQYLIIGDLSSLRLSRLANHIKQSLEDEPCSWNIESTIALCDMVLGDADIFQIINNAITKYQPTYL